MCVEPTVDRPGSETREETFERDDVRQHDDEDTLRLQCVPHCGKQTQGFAGVFEDVDAKNDVVLRTLDFDPLEIHDAVLVGIGATPSLRLQDIDADDVDRPPDLEALLTGLDVQHLEHPVTREDGVDKSLGSRAFDIDRPDGRLVLQVTQRRAGDYKADLRTVS